MYLYRVNHPGKVYNILCKYRRCMREGDGDEETAA